MGREIKRVALDFDWPINKVWPFYKLSTCIDDCDECRAAAKIRGMEFTEYNCPKFKEYDPPEGDGYQLWETTSEGSPMSPVFQTPEELAKWLDINQISSFSDMTCNYDQWLNFIYGSQWAPSAIIENGELKSGVCGV